MTDVSLLQTHAEPQLGPVSGFATAPTPPAHGIPTRDGTAEEEDNESIKCICGFVDDDGHTVLCELCKTWQHISCYYWPECTVGDDAVHECVDCRPRRLDAIGAKERQRNNRDGYNVGERRGKKPTQRSHKKKLRDPMAALPQTNGWSPLDRHDRTSGSPRDQPPPAKRPKTTHKTSGSVSSLNHHAPGQGQGPRKRAGSTMHNAHSPSRSPTETLVNGYTSDYFSPEFMELYRNPEPPACDASSYTSINTSNLMRTWLDDPDALAAATDGKTKTDVFYRLEESAEQSEKTAPSITCHEREDTSITVHGTHPIFKWLTVDSDVPSGKYLGELKGTVGHRDEYLENPANRWKALRHPLPFVFFTPHLPLYIDTRSEGNLLRYIRRSCCPNTQLLIFIEEEEYHFCLMAINDINAGDEITINWEMDQEILRLVGKSLRTGEIKTEGFSDEEKKQLSRWVVPLLKTFGACAHFGGSCHFERFDNRISDVGAQYPKIAKQRMSKKTGSHISPPGTGPATNSRAGSEGFHRADQEDAVDSPSASGSSRSKPTSRDITPMTHVSADQASGFGMELSERERKKAMQAERLFEKLELEQNGTRKKKRNSGGSALNTPSVATSKQLGHADSAISPSTYQAHGMMPVTTRKQFKVQEASEGRSNPDSRGPQRQSGNPSTRRAPFVRPVYTDASSQTDIHSVYTIEDRYKRKPKPILTNVEKFRKMARQAREKNQRIAEEHKKEQARLAEQDQGSSANGERPLAPEPEPVPMEVDSVPASELQDISSKRPVASPEALISSPISSMPPASAATDQPDVEMKDADNDAASGAPHMEEGDAKSTAVQISPESPRQSSHPPIQPPPPPWPSATAATSTSPTTPTPTTNPQRPPSLHVQLPPVPPFQSTTVPSAADQATSITGFSMAQSPSILSTPTPLLSPAISNIAAPSPAKKKMSLSDYTKRKQSAAQAATPLPSSSVAEGQASKAPIAPMTSPGPAESAPAADAIKAEVKIEDASNASNNEPHTLNGGPS